MQTELIMVFTKLGKIGFNQLYSPSQFFFCFALWPEMRNKAAKMLLKGQNAVLAEFIIHKGFITSIHTHSQNDQSLPGHTNLLSNSNFS